MLDITSKISKLINQEPVSEAEYSGGQISTLFTSFNNAGVECEVGEYLYAMVRLLKPECVLETGTHQGISTLYMAQAMADNGFGIIDTIELIPEHYQTAKSRFEESGLGKYINLIHGNINDWEPSADRRYRFTLLDTEPQLRFGEFVRLYDYFAMGGFVMIHDLHQHMGQVDNQEHGYAWPWGKLPHLMKERVQNNEIRPFHFATPRGLTGFYIVNDGDYSWKREVEE